MRAIDSKEEQHVDKPGWKVTGKLKERKKGALDADVDTREEEEEKGEGEGCEEEEVATSRHVQH